MTIEAMTAARTTVSINKACELLDVSRRTIYNWMASGKVERVRTVTGSTRIFVDTLWRTPDDPAVSPPGQPRSRSGRSPASPHISATPDPP